MAKPKVNKITVNDNDEVTIGVPTEELEIINPQLRGKLSDIKEKEESSEEVSILTPETPKVVVTMVKVKLNKDHRCYIGGEWYTFIAGKQYNVPSNVKDILIGANLLLPL